MEKDKKKTLTISSSLKKKIDTSSISSNGKKSFSIEKRKSFKNNKSHNKPFNRSSPDKNFNAEREPKKRNFARNSLSNRGETGQARPFPERSGLVALCCWAQPLR